MNEYEHSPEFFFNLKVYKAMSNGGKIIGVWEVPVWEVPVWEVPVWEVLVWEVPVWEVLVWEVPVSPVFRL
jgi:hypothetical protein